MSLLKGIMSSYALAQLTNRQFLIDISKPCDFREMLVPSQLNWNISSYKLAENAKNLLIYCIDDPKCPERFNTMNTSSYELGTDVIKINLNNDWLAYFSSNKRFESDISRLGYAPDNFKLIYMMREWYDKLFKLSPKLQAQYDMIKANITQDTQILCAQLRIGGQRPNVPHDSLFNDISVTTKFWRFIREEFVSKLASDNWKLFITTDTEVVEQEAVREFGTSRLIRIPGVFSHVDMEENAESCSRVEKPILDFHFLRNCDKAVISSSGFGKLGTWIRANPVKDLYVFINNKFTKANLSMKILDGSP